VIYEPPFFSGLHGKKFHEGGANNISIFPLKKKKPYLPRASDLNSNNLHNKSTFSPCNLQSALYNYELWFSHSPKSRYPQLGFFFFFFFFFFFSIKHTQHRKREEAI
jgi:hypothetical protein